MKLNLSKTSLDIESVRAIRWNIDESGIKRDDRGVETRVYWRRTYVYFKNISDCLTLTDSCDDYESDVEKLREAWEQQSV